MLNAAARLLSLLTLILVPPVLDAQAQNPFEATAGLQTWSQTKLAEHWQSEGSNRLFILRSEPAAARGTAEEDARRKAYEVAAVDPGILIFPDTLVDTSMVISPRENVDPLMILPPEARTRRTGDAGRSDLNPPSE